LRDVVKQLAVEAVSERLVGLLEVVPAAKSVSGHNGHNGCLGTLHQTQAGQVAAETHPQRQNDFASAFILVPQGKRQHRGYAAKKATNIGRSGGNRWGGVMVCVLCFRKCPWRRARMQNGAVVH
jgi:hypothetical protein